MKWNLRLAAAQRGIWKASELQRMLADRGLVISTGKMSGLWSGNPASFKGSDLDALCAVLGCGIAEIMIPEPDAFPLPGADTTHHAATGSTGAENTDTAGRRSPPSGGTGDPCRRREQVVRRPTGRHLRRLPGLRRVFARRLCAACYAHDRKWPKGTCRGCRHRSALRQGYCRLCWGHARTLAHETGDRHISAIHRIAEVRYPQLFLQHHLAAPSRRFEPVARQRPPPHGSGEVERSGAPGCRPAAFPIRRSCRRSGRRWRSTVDGIRRGRGRR
jgi:DNA-binding Xre family transcriptional regulator